MKWLNSMLADGVDGSVSSKRVITLAAFLLCAFAFVVDLTTSYKANPALFDSMMYIVIAGLGFTATEKFVKKEIK
jgi:hypothetical protein